MVSRQAQDLEDMRTKLVAAMSQVDAKDLPRVIRELRAVNSELEALAPSVSAGQKYIDQLKERRAQRMSAP